MKSLNIIGRCGAETLKKVLKEKVYINKDFYYLKRLILKNYSDKISSFEGKSIFENNIEISFSYIDKRDKEEEIIFLSEKINQYYTKCEGRIYWRYKLSKYEDPKFVYDFENLVNPETYSPTQILNKPDDFFELPDNNSGDNLPSLYEGPSDLSSIFNKSPYEFPDESDNLGKDFYEPDFVFNDYKSSTNNPLTSNDSEYKEKFIMPAEFDFTFSKTSQKQLAGNSNNVSPRSTISPPIISSPPPYSDTHSDMGLFLKQIGQLTVFFIKMILDLLVLGLKISLFLVLIYFFFKMLPRIL